MDRIRRKCGFINEIYVSAEGSREGLSLGWKDELKISLKSFSKSQIDVHMNEGNGEAS